MKQSNFFRVWSVSVALVWFILPSGDMRYMCIKFEHSHTLFLGSFPDGTLNYVSIRNHVSTRRCEMHARLHKVKNLGTHFAHTHRGLGTFHKYKCVVMKNPLYPSPKPIAHSATTSSVIAGCVSLLQIFARYCDINIMMLLYVCAGLKMGSNHI